MDVVGWQRTFLYVPMATVCGFGSGLGRCRSVTARIVAAAFHVVYWVVFVASFVLGSSLH